jgi:hypothetical protein
MNREIVVQKNLKAWSWEANWDHKVHQFVHLFKPQANNQRGIHIHILHHRGCQWANRLEQHQS